MFCRQCGTPNDPSSQFCSNCGAPLSNAAVPSSRGPLASEPAAPAARPSSPTPPARPISPSPAPSASQPNNLPQQMAPAPRPGQPKSWLARKWKVLVGLFVALVVLGIAVAFGIVALVMSSIKGSDVAKEALARAKSTPAVVQQLGTPIEEGFLVSGSINVSTGSGDADLAIPISGPKGKGTVYVTAKKDAGVWTYSLMQAAMDGSGERIDLLAQPGAGSATAIPTPGPAAENGAASPVAAAAATPSAVPSTGPAPLVTEDTNITGIVAEVTQCARKDGVLNVKVRFRNANPAAKNVPIISSRNYDSFYVSAGSKKYFVLKDSDGTYLMPRPDGMGYLSADVDPGGQYTWWAKFPAPPGDVKKVTLYIPQAPPLEDIPVSDN